MIVSIPKIRIIVPTLHYHMFLRLEPFRSDEYKYAKRKRTIFNLVLSPFPSKSEAHKWKTLIYYL